jgi:hypothetical protein
MQESVLDAGTQLLMLDVEELEAMEAPGFWDTVGGIAVGTVVGGAALYGGVAIGIAIT